MNFQKFVENLNNPKVPGRMASVFILGMIDEVRAIDALRKRYARESNRQVKQAMQVVGGQLAKLKRDGYDTVEEICEQFQINRELKALAGADEDAKIKDIQKNTSHNKKDDDFNDQLWSAASGLVHIGSAFAGAGPGMVGPSANVDMTSNLGDTSEFINQQNRRIPPVRPTNDNISIWIERLMTESNPDTRIDLIIQIANHHNSAALPYLANVHWTDSDERVKAAAKKYGKLIYLNALYWDMVNDGSLQKIIDEKANKLGVIVPEENMVKIDTDRLAHNQSLDDILAAAERKRKKKRR